MRPPPPGSGWPDEVRKKGEELLRATGNATEALAGLVKAFTFEEKAPSRSTLVGWAKAAGIVLGPKSPSTARDTEPALEARLARVEAARAELSELLVAKLAKPAAELLVRRVEEAQTVEEAVAVAFAHFYDAVRFEAQVVGDFGAGAEDAKLAKKATGIARAELEAVAELRITPHNLVGIVTRAVNDHLALEGEGSDVAGDLIAEFTIPRPDPEAQKVVDQASLSKTEVPE